VKRASISDKDPAKAQALAEPSGAQIHTGDNDAVIAHPEVNAVVVSTPEGEHAPPVVDILTYYVDPMCWFLEGNKPSRTPASARRR
jgi:predicted dehydrogenase